MLTLLRISNYAIIDDVEIELKTGFNVMTGETGAGKSILVDALGLALGDRADATAVRAGSRRAEISLVFELDATHPALDWLVERGLDDDGTCCLRRIVSAEGRSRAFINNQPVTLKDLRSVGSQLVDIHGQHAHQSLLTAKAQRAILDASGKLQEQARSVAAAYENWQALSRQLRSREGQSANRDAELELLRFQLKDVELLDLSPGEPEALRHECDRLRHVDQLQQAIGQSAELLYVSDVGSSHALIGKSRELLESVVEHDAGLSGLLDRIASLEIETKDLAGELSHRLDQLEADPARLDEVETRLDQIKQLARRHQIAEDEVPMLADRLRNQIEALDAGAESFADLEARCSEAHTTYRELAGSLSASRHAAASRLGDAVSEKLAELGLPSATLAVRVSPKPEGREDSTGLDQIEFAVSTNVGQPPGPIDRIASGGELSRIGLALGVVAIDASTIPTLIFDEVDAGIGGGVAEVVGRRLHDLAASHQVLCVTHLPQVASQGTQHYRISKLSDGQSSRTQVRELNDGERVEELSRMLGGVEITAATRAHAEEMIRQAARKVRAS